MAQTPCLLENAGGSVKHTPGSDVAAGAVVLLGTIPAIAAVAIPSGTQGVLTLFGLWKVPQKAEIITKGDAVYWDSTGDPYGGTGGSGAATGTASIYIMGVAAYTTTATDTYVYVSLHGAKRTATIGGAVTASDIEAEDATLGINGLDAAQGGSVPIAAGTSSTSGNAGGAASLAGGVPGVTGVGGAASVTGGVGGTTSGTGGASSVTGGAAASAASNAVGGAASVTGGIGKGNLAGGASSVVGGVGGSTGDGGAVTVTGGATDTGASGTGGVVVITGGANANATNGAGGASSITGGAGKGSGVGGASSVTGGAAAGSGDGGNVVLTGGTSGSGVAGAVVLRGDTYFAQDAATAEAAGAQTIAAADFVNGIVVHTVTTGATLTTPTGAEIAAVLPTGITTGDAFKLYVITVGTGGDDISTLTAGDGSVTFVGDVTVGPHAAGTNGFGTWIFRMTGATSFVGYRVG